MTQSGTNNPIPAIIAGLVAGLITTLTAISYSSLLFGGSLQNHAAEGIALGLFSALVFSIVVTALSSFAGTIAIPQARIAPLMALMIGALVTQLGPEVADQQRFLTVVASICAASLLTGLLLLLLGVFQAGRFIRFIPYPVVGGFLAGTGWLLVAGSFSVMTGDTLDLSQLDHFLSTDQLMRWGPGVVLATGLVLVLRGRSHFLTTPATLVAAIALFYGFLYATGHDRLYALDNGFLLGPMPESEGFHFITLDALRQADWSVIAEQSGILFTIAMVSTLSLLLNASSMELAARSDMDLNQELRAAGVANLVSGAGGGLVGFHAVGASVLVIKLGAPQRIAGYTSALLPALVLIVGLDLVAYLPRFVVGGLLLFVGLSFMVEWVVDAYRRLGRADYSVVIIILLTVGSVGYLEGIAVGMTAALVLFVINYSRINVVKQALNGALQQSNVDRPEAMRRVIKKEGEHTIIFKLQGFIFFGTANGLLDRIKADIENEKRPKPRFIILDFRAVTGFDSSAAISFVKLSQLAERVGFDVILSGISEGALRALRREGVDDNHHRVHIQPDLDRALEFTEDNILSSHGLEDAELLTGFQNLVNDTRLSEQEAERLLAQMDRLALGADDEFIVQGTHSDALYFLEEGQVSVNLKLPDGRVIRLRTTGAGTIIGEMGLYLNQPRTASVITDEPCVVLRMRSDDLARLETKEPAIAAAFHRYMTKLIAERLGQTNQVLERVL